MKIRRKGIQVCVGLLTLSFLLFFSAYLFYNTLVETDFAHSNPTFENLDQNYLPNDHQDRLKIPKPSTFPTIMETALSGKVFLAFQKSFLRQKIIIFRC
jgi:hypothetical protein